MHLMVVLGLFSGVAQSAHAKELISQMDHTSWTARDGAPQAITALAQAPDGTLWIGTEGGLFSFDGITFTAFQSPPGQPQLPAGPIRSVTVSRDGAVWVGMHVLGVARIANGRVDLFDTADGDRFAQVKDLQQAPDGTVWCRAWNLLLRFGDDGAWHQDRAAEQVVGGSTLRRFFIGSTGTQWLAWPGHLYRRSSDQSQFAAVSIDVGIVMAIAEAPDGTVLVSDVDTSIDVGRTRRLDRQGNDLGPVGRGDELLATLPMPDGSLWLDTQAHGLRRIWLDTGTPSAPSPEGEVEDVYRKTDGLSSDIETTLLRDKDNNVWAAGRSGLDRFRTPWLVRFSGREESDWSVCTNDRGEVWIANKSSQLFSVAHGKTRQFSGAGDTYSMSCGKEGKVFLLDHGGLRSVTDGQFRSIPMVPGAKPYGVLQVVETSDHTLIAIVDDPFGGYWMLKNEQWTKLEVAGIEKPSPRAQLVDSHDRLWAGYGTWSGKIGLVENGRGRLFTVASPGLGATLAFLESSRGIFAAGLNGIAIFRGNGFDMLTFSDPGIARGVMGLVEARNGDIWLSGYRGLVRIPADQIEAALKESRHPMTAELVKEGDLIGPAPFDRMGNTAAIDLEGKLWFAMLNGVVSVDPEHPPPPPGPPVLSIRSITFDRNTLDPRKSVPAKPQTLSIRYFGVNLSAPDDVIYKYRLDGLDDAWQGVGRRTEAIYTRLPPGTYTFRVMASNGNGIWTPPLSSQSFTVLPSFYQTWWFAVICIAAILLALWFALTLRVRYIAAAIRTRIEGRADERIRIARELHDTLLQGFQGLLLRFQAATDQIPPEQPARAMMELALDRAEDVLVEGRDHVRNLRATQATTELSQMLADAADRLEFDPQVNVRVIVEGTPRDLHPIICDEIVAIGKEALFNISRHAKAKAIEIDIRYDRRQLEVKFIDDGVGIDEALLAQGREGHFGLTGMRERAGKIRASLAITSRVGAGTEIELAVPASVAYAKNGRGAWRWPVRQPELHEN